MLMDEPFGAIDPINRERLQNEFLRLQAELRKTVVFVTHDIDEAIKMGDRIAIMQEGGVLAQYAPPAEVLMYPASPFVEDFVGADRALKRLALERVRDVDLPPAADGTPDGPRIPRDALLRDALSDLLAHQARCGPVVDSDGRVIGVLSIDAVARAIATTPERE
jgi:osmoprotectant transport system ATP-binding protein